MKIIIIVHSHTGITRKFAEKINSRLVTCGHKVNCVYLATDREIDLKKLAQPREIMITNLPDISGYDAVLVGGPVWGFKPSPLIKACLDFIPDFRGKKFLAFITMMLPFKFMGGKNSLRLLNTIAEQKHAKVMDGFISSKIWHNQERDMTKNAEQIGKILG